MNNPKLLKRRRFLELSGLSFAALPLIDLTKAITSDSTVGYNPICIFSEHFQWLDYREMGKLMNDVGFDGVNITVRNGGHVAPYDVERKLPEAVREIENYGLLTPMITTDILNVENDLTEPILKTASELGIQFYRMGHFRYDRYQPIVQQLDRMKEKVMKLAELNEKYKIKGNYQNFSGLEVGSSVWDIWYIMKDISSEWIGVQFDIKNAMVEGGKSWENDLLLVKDMVQSTVISDFNWVSGAKDVAYTEGVPIGEGMVDFSKYFKMFKKLNVGGPLTVNLDFPFYEEQPDQLKREKINASRKVLGMELRNLKNYLVSEGIR